MARELVTEKDVQDVAILSRIEFGDDEIKRIQKDLNEVVEYFGVLKEVDTSKVEGIVNFATVPREDVVKESMLSADVVKNAPEHNKNSYIVPRVVE